jgi:uncharacterized protein (TIGR02001 family)
MLYSLFLTKIYFFFGESKMLKSFLTASAVSLIVGLVPAIAQAQAAKAPEPDYTLTGNISLVTDYRYRGISQSRLKPALQGTVDFAHKSGFYLGAFATNIKWIKDTPPGNANVEIDLYGGYKGTIVGDLGYDVGLLQYVYPSNNYAKTSTGAANANTLEAYGGLTYKQFTLKYFRSLTNTFGNGNSKGSGYIDAGAAFDLGDGWGVNAHIGHQSIRNSSAFSYTDYKLGVTKELAGFVFGASVIGTDTDAYKYGNATTLKTKNLGKAGIVLSAGKNF